MTVTLTINVAGRPKRDIVELAHELCGISGFTFDLTPEEMSSSLRVLDLMMAEHPYNLMGYDPATYGNGLPEDPSGLSEQDVAAVYPELARRIASSKGKQLGPPAIGIIVSAAQTAQTRYATIPTMPLAQKSVRGTGASRLTPYISETTG